MAILWEDEVSIAEDSLGSVEFPTSCKIVITSDLEVNIDKDQP